MSWKAHWLRSEPYRLLHFHFGLLDWEPWRGTWVLHVGWTFYMRIKAALRAESEARRASSWYSGFAELNAAYEAPHERGLRLSAPGGSIRLLPDLAD